MEKYLYVLALVALVLWVASDAMWFLIDEIHAWASSRRVDDYNEGEE